MKQPTILLDPSAEEGPARRQRLAPPASLDGLTVGLLDISKARGDIFIDQLGKQLEARGIRVKHYAKPTSAKVAPVPLTQTIASECAVVVEALAD